MNNSENIVVFESSSADIPSSIDLLNLKQNVQEPNKIINSSSPTICLCMIVKNESSIICRLFDSIVNIIDVYCICDTGSTDDTAQIISEYWKTKNIKGKIIGCPFADFSTNRNVAINACNGLSDYILLLDADMELVINEFNKNIIIPYDEIGIQQGSSEFSYVNTRIIKNNGQYTYKGVTHETISRADTHNIKSAVMSPEILRINDYDDGGNRSTKYQRDINLLTDALNNKTYTSDAEKYRYIYYLGNSYYDTNEHPSAFKQYSIIIDLFNDPDVKDKGSLEPYIYSSLIKCGSMLSNAAESVISEKDRCITFWLQAIDLNPESINAYYYIVSYYRKTHRRFIAKMVCDTAFSKCKLLHNRVKQGFDAPDIKKWVLEFENLLLEFNPYTSSINLDNANVPLLRTTELSVLKTQVGNVLMNADDSTIHDVMNLLPNITDVWTNIDRDEKFCSATIDIASFTKLESKPTLISFSITHYNNSGYYVNLCTKTSNNDYLNTAILLDNLFNRLHSINIEDRILCCSHKLHLITSNVGTPIYMACGIETNKMFVGVYNIMSSLSFNSRSIDMSFEMTPLCAPFALNDTIVVVIKWYPLQIFSFGDIPMKTVGHTPCIFNFVVSSTNGCWFNDNLWFLLTANIKNSTSSEFYFFAKFNLTMSSVVCSIPFKCSSDLGNLNFSSLIIEQDKVICGLSENTSLQNFHIKTYSKAVVDSLFI